MQDILTGKENAAGLHIGQDDGVGFLGGETGVLPGVVGMATLIVHRHDHLGAVAHTGLIVVRAKAGGGVYAAGTGVHGDVIGQHQKAGLGQEGVIGQHILEEAPFMGLHDLPALDLPGLHDLLHQRLGHDVHLARGHLDDGVAVAGAERDADVAGQRPGRGCPDEEEEPRLVQVA